MSKIAHFKLNDNLATTNVLAVVGSDGTLVGGNNTQDLSESGKIDRAIHFDGSADYINIGLQSLSGASGSICCWFKADATNPTGNKYIIGRNVAGNADGDIAIWLRDSDNKIGIFIQDGSTTYNAYANSAQANTNWYWVCAVWSSTEVALYINNVKQTETGAGTDLAAHATAPFSIGSVNGSTAGTEAWDGLIDDVRIFDHVLSSDGRAFFYNSGNGTEDEYYITQAISDTVTLDDEWEILTNPEQQGLSDSILLSDEWEILTNPEQDNIFESISLDDEWDVYTNPEQEGLNDSVSLSDNWVTSLIGDFTYFINTDLRWLTLFTENIKTSLDWILAKTINTDLRWLKIYKPSINTDLRWLSNSYNVIPPITLADVQIFINSVDLLLNNDIDVQTGNIVHTIGQKSVASFTLARRHDDLDRTHTGSASQITNQNPVQIYIKGHLEFDGFISNLSVNSESETVVVTCLMDEPADNRHSIELPLPSVNEKLHLYHCLVNAVQIDNPKEDIDEPNPQYYKGIKVDLGLQIQQQTDTWRLLELIYQGKGVTATKVEEGTFITRPNYSYFWAVNVRNARTGVTATDYRYIGTSLASTTTDLWVINGATPTYQKIMDNIETELGYYFVGAAPYKEISCKNGKLIIAAKYEDMHDGLYHVYDAHYDYTGFAQLVADLEYQKLLSVGGEVLPITSANIDVTFDAYYYYAIKLLTRINVTNTTVANTFNNTNGFPVSVKGININFSTMRVTLNTDNRLSQEELDEIDAQMPDDEDSIYLVPESIVRVYRKFDLKSWSYVS